MAPVLVGISQNENAECTSISNLICSCGGSSRCKADRCNEKTAALRVVRKTRGSAASKLCKYFEDTYVSFGIKHTYQVSMVPEHCS
ncbi:uncharacterized protein TRAVEDRAFT_27512 [Trametes versicolor FP-101664 SS1]|uniref:uncharacterized protein n=1 Tax=Trametes versicolor (strain FP-101664) TaxID=717944 RepID=UPI0004622460|nr:uncharacterized protein TRAVEDRAFT_27512 [Trametes versicolor FP-101664 SS1]EIW62157.1 hypothetical protein TRAVEDRAFT_27512 [Trametes versicolor FP-101664 SS1]